MAKPVPALSLTIDEINALGDALLEVAQQMDDDGREGAFAASPLRSVFRKVIAAKRAVEG